MNSISQAFETSKTRSVRIYRWVTAWLGISAVIALLLLANSIRDYGFVSRLIATEQVRHQMSQHATALERQLRQDPLTRGSAVNSLMEAGGNPVWIELRGPDGKVLEHAGGSAPRLFSEDEEHTHARNHEPLYRVVATAAGDVVVEVFAIRAPAAPIPANPPAQSGPPAPMMLEIATPLSSVDQSNFWPIRRNLLINCSGALALLVTVVVAGLGFRSYAHGKYLEEQLEIAGQVQSELLPPLTEEYVGVLLATEYTPAEKVGGDFYDVFRLKDERIALVMGDVSGKGVPAALLMGVIHGAVRSSLWSESPSRHESESQQLNRLLCERASGERYASMFWCYHDAIAHTLSYVNAGHCPPLLTRKNGSKVEISRLHVGGPVLGVLPDARYEQAKLQISPGDLLVMYSDGLVEAINSHGEEFGEGRLRELLATLTEKSADDIRRAILASLAAFSGSAELRDDLTIVVAQFTSTDDSLPKGNSNRTGEPRMV
ncbi:MAG: PP2C family protein-serine/threonine phosphatase [Candidatus Sulfotelmatobacter sp.]